VMRGRSLGFCPLRVRPPRMVVGRSLSLLA